MPCTGQQRCSASTITKALAEVRDAGTSTGAIKYETAPGTGFLYGFEYFCKGTGDSKCAYYDAVDAHCNREKDQWSSQKLQFDGVARQRRVENFKYRGTTWLSKPTPKAEAPVHSWSTVRKAAHAEPTPSAEDFVHPANAYISKARPQPKKTQGPSSFAIVPPGPTGVPKA